MKTIWVARSEDLDGYHERMIAAETREHAESAAALWEGVVEGVVEVEEVPVYEASDPLPIEQVTVYWCAFIFRPAVDENRQPLRFQPGSVEIKRGSEQGQPADLYGPQVDVHDYPNDAFGVVSLGWRTAHIAELLAAEEFERQLAERGLSVRMPESVR